MNLGLLLIPALGGYHLLARSHVSRYWMARQSGYKLFFSAERALLHVAATHARKSLTVLSFGRQSRFVVPT